MPELMIYDDIGADFFGEGVTAKGVQAQLAEFEGDLTVRINSYGGDVFQGQAIYNLLRAYPGDVTVVVDGIAASAASIIAMAGDDIVMPRNSMLMIHDPWTVAVGGSEDMLKTAEVLDQIKTTIVAVYTDRTGLTYNAVADMMTQETWLNADEAEQLGFATQASTEAPALNSIAARPWINSAPKPVEKTEPEPQESTQSPARQNARRRQLEIMSDDIGQRTLTV